MVLSVVDVVTFAVYGLVLLSIVAVLFLERKDPTTTLTWVLVLSYLPVIGLILYIFFGRGLKIFTIRKLLIRNQIREKYWQLPGRVREDIDRTMRIRRGEEVPLSDPSAGDYAPLMRLNFALCDAIYSQNNSVEIYTDARVKYDALLADIRGARNSIHLVYFIIDNSSISREILAALTAKAREGVQVRLIYDELGSITTPNTLFRELRRAGGEVYRFFPLKLGSLLHANYRNHHKIVVVDGEVAYTGGMNIGDEYMGLHPRKTPWRDTHLRITGNAVQSLQFLFLLDLYYATEDEALLLRCLGDPATFPPPICQGEIGMQVVHSGPDQEEEAVKRGMIAMINGAQRTIYLQTPYLMPDGPVLEALQNAAKSGVEVVIMLPGVPDKRTVYFVTFSYIGHLLDYGAKVYLHRGFLHAKMLVVDDRVCTIGTCNLDIRSFAYHFEVNCFFYNTSLAKSCGDIFRRDLEDCLHLDRETYRRRGRFRIFLERLLRLFAPLM